MLSAAQVLALTLSIFHEYFLSWFPQNLENLEMMGNVNFFGKSVKTWKRPGKLLKKHIRQGKLGNNFWLVFVVMIWILQYDIIY